MSLRYAIMTALLDDEMSGYDLARAFDKSLGFFWHASHQQIYRELRTLSDNHWVSHRDDPDGGRRERHLYRLTDAGRAALDEWVLQRDRMRIQEIKDEFYIKLYNLSEGNIDYLVGPEQLPLRRKGVYLALLSGISQGRQYLAWCDEALALLAGECTEGVLDRSAPA